MIRLQDKTNVDAPTVAYPFGKIRDDVPGTPGTPVDEQLYGDAHQFLEKLFEESGHTANDLPDNETNGFQLYEALLAIIAKGAPGTEEGEWIDGGTPTLTPDTGTVTVFSTLYNRYKIIGKTLFWQLRGAFTVNSGSPTMVRVSYPTVFTMPNFNAALPHKIMGFYKSNLQTMCEVQAAGIEMKIFPSAVFSGTEQLYGFDLIQEIN